MDFRERLTETSFVIEYAREGSLQDLIGTADSLAPKVMIRYAGHILKAVDYLHDQGLVHNDIKPSNILISKKDRAKLSDFAFSGNIGEETFNHLPESMIVGTDLYKPRSERHSRINSVHHDIYAIGIVLYQLFNRSVRPDRIDLNQLLYKEIQTIVAYCMAGHYKRVSDIQTELEAIPV